MQLGNGVLEDDVKNNFQEDMPPDSSTDSRVQNLPPLSYFVRTGENVGL